MLQMPFGKLKSHFFALRLLDKYFIAEQMRSLLDSNFYFILYYNAVIWLNPQLSACMQQELLSISANALRSCMMYNCAKICKKSTPKQKMLYQISLKLYKLMKEINDCCTFEHVTLADQIICTRRQSTYEIQNCREYHCK